MFCSKCGGNLQEGTAFCPGCGAKVGGDAAVQEAPKPAAQDNVESGIPLSASPAMLHKKLVSSLYEVPCLPLDFFEKTEVIREERYCVPAYCFHCNGTESFNYEVGNERQQVVVRDNGKKSWEETRRHMEWTPSNGTASVRQTIFASSNRKMAPQIKKLYTYFDSKKLIGAGELAFPAGVDTLNSDLPQIAAFNEFAVPCIEQALKKKAEESISKQTTTGLKLGGAQIQKDTAHVLLGLYHIVYKYGDKESSVWMTGDGQKAYHEGLPEDAQRKSTLEEKEKSKKRELESIPPLKTGGLTFGLVFSIVVLLPTLGVSLIPAIICGVKRSKKKKKYYAQKDEIEMKYQNDIAEFKRELSNAVQKFKEQKKALHGIYESVSGDVNAF